MTRLSFCSSRAVDFSPGRVTASIIADFQLCTDMFPGSAHINDTLVSIVTKGERRGKGVLRWAKGIQPKAATQGGWEEGSVFPTTGFRIRCGLCLPSGPSPCPLHIQMQWCAEQKSHQGSLGWGRHRGGASLF